MAQSSVSRQERAQAIVLMSQSATAHALFVRVWQESGSAVVRYRAVLDARVSS